MYPAIILIGILIVLFVKFNSSEVYSILTSEVLQKVMMNMKQKLLDVFQS